MDTGAWPRSLRNTSQLSYCDLEERLHTTIMTRWHAKTVQFKKRIEQALSAHHVLPNIMHPGYRGQSLTDREIEIAMQLAATEHEPTVADLINLKAQSPPFMKYMFAENVIKGVKPVDWWVYRPDCVHLDTVMLQNKCLKEGSGLACDQRPT